MSIVQTPMQQPSGSRRLTLTMLTARDRADQFQGVPQGTGKPLRYLAAFQEAEPYLGLPPQAYKLVAWLVKQTMPQDWEQGSRPICWPSASRQSEFLALSPARVKMLNRALFEAGIFIIRDSETGKRYGRRNAEGHIVEAYGFDLSPLAYRYEEFVRVAAEARIERDKIRALRKRATQSRRAIRQAGETLATFGALSSEWTAIAAETAELVAALSRIRLSADLAVAVKSLEDRQNRAEALLRRHAQSVETDPEGLVSKPHTISTNKSFDPKDTVMAQRKGCSGEGASRLSNEAITESSNSETLTTRRYDRAEGIDPVELVELTPRLGELVDARSAAWTDIIAAAGTTLRIDLGVSQSLWGEACRVLGRQLAAVTLAVVSTKPKEYFARGAGGYFAAMVKRGERGELHLDRTLWKLRREKWGEAKRAGARW